MNEHSDLLPKSKERKRYLFSHSASGSFGASGGGGAGTVGGAAGSS